MTRLPCGRATEDGVLVSRPGGLGMGISTDPSAVSAVPSSKHMCGIVRYARLFQQRQELVFERHFLVVFGLTPNVSCDLIKLRSTHAERPIPVLPLEYQATFRNREEFVLKRLIADANGI